MSSNYFFVGIDYSLAGPAVTVIVDNKPTHYYLTDKKKFVGPIKESLIGTAYPEYHSENERYHALSNWVLDIISATSLKSGLLPIVYIEGYSFGSTGASLAQIHENAGILKYRLFQQSISFVNVPPTTVKKSFCGKGNGTKTEMCEHFIKTTGVKLHEEFGSKNVDSKPAQDIVDSYAIALYAKSNHTAGR